MSTITKIDSNYVHSELSYKIIGVLFEVYNNLGYGHAEKVYQKAIALALAAAGLAFVEQLYVPVFYMGNVVGKNFLDFLIEGKVEAILKIICRRNFRILGGLAPNKF